MNIINTYFHNESVRKDIFVVSLGIIVFCMCLYIYSVTTTVRNIVEKKRLTLEILDISEKISTKQFSLIALENNITPDFANKLGFKDPKTKTFVTRQSVSFVYPQGKI